MTGVIELDAACLLEIRDAWLKCLVQGDHPPMLADLKKVPLLRSLPAAELQRLDKLCELRRFGKGETIFQEGRPAGSVWIIRRGWVFLVKRTPQGRLGTIFAMTPQETLCGVSAFEHGVYSASAIAATDTQLIQLPAEEFSNLLERYPKFTKQILLTCCTRMRHMAKAISMAQGSVEQRLVYVLLRLQKTFGSTIPLTHRELARMAGTRSETSIRTLASMRRKGWVRSSRGEVRILAPKKLRALLRETAEA